MKIQIMTDLEGPAGVNGQRNAEIGIGGKIVNLPTAAARLAREVNACVEGLTAAGAGEIVVWDGHGGSDTLDIAQLHPAASLGTIGGDLAPACFIDAGFAAAVQIGAHAMQGTADGYLCHTFNGRSVQEMRLNGEAIGEIGMGALLAGYFGVPTILVSGDRAACREASAFLGPAAATVATKDASSRYTVVNRPAADVERDLAAAAAEALGRVRDIPPPRLAPPYELRLRLMCPNQADMYEKAGAERVDRQTVVFAGDDLVDLWAQYCGWAPGVHNRKFGIRPVGGVLRTSE